jgi:hypothetical protein
VASRALSAALAAVSVLILAAAGFRCNVQEATGVSCLSEFSDKGFTFSADGFAPQYTDFPMDAP